jgi:hypothetical protein
MQARQHHQDGHVAVLPVVAAVLGDLGRAAGVDNAVLGDADDVGNPRVADRDPDEGRRAGAGVDLLQTGCLDRDRLLADIVPGRRVRQQVGLDEAGRRLWTGRAWPR